MKLCFTEDQVTISSQHHEVLKVCSHRVSFGPGLVSKCLLVNEAFSSDAASRAPECGLKLQSWTWCFLWDGQKEPFWKRPEMLNSLQETVLGMRNWQQRGHFSRGLERRALFPLCLYGSFVALKGSFFLFRMRSHLASEARHAINSTLGYWFPWCSTALPKGPHWP